jgi:hypothetical protein
VLVYIWLPEQEKKEVLRAEYTYLSHVTPNRYFEEK